jgi:hypothetical protein
MKNDKDDKTEATAGRKTIWAFLIIGITVLLAGIFVNTPIQSVTLSKTEILTGAALIITAVAALVITA